MLRVKDVDVYYGEVQVLKDLTINVTEKEIVTLIGANGAGKTTTLKAIAGLLNISCGEIEFLSKRVDLTIGHRRVRNGIVLIPEGRHLFPEMTVKENIISGAFSRRDNKEIMKDFNYIFELFPILREREKQLAGTLSGGEQQMLAIARGIMSRPKLLMLDEPSLGLAPKVVELIFNIIKEINNNGVTILLVEQNAHLALKIADTGYVIETGKIVLNDKAQNLLNNQKVKEAYLGM